MGTSISRSVKHGAPFTWGWVGALPIKNKFKLSDDAIVKIEEANRHQTLEWDLDPGCPKSACLYFQVHVWIIEGWTVFWAYKFTGMFYKDLKPC